MLEILLYIGFPYSFGHRIVKVRYGLTSMHLILVRLYCYACEGGIGADTIRLPEVSMAGRESAVE